MRSCIMQNIKKRELFWCESLNQRHPTAALDYTRYGILVENLLLVEAYMKSQYRWKTPSHIRTHE